MTSETDDTEKNTNGKSSEPQRPELDQPLEHTPSIAGPVDGAEVQGEAAREIGGRKGPDPVRYGDWEKQGRCIDF